MGLLDVFSFKKAFQAVYTPENFELINAIIKEKIIELVKEKFPGQEKMDKVVEAVVDFIRKHMASNNGIVNWITEVILIPNVRKIAQAVYDALKQKVKDL